MDIEPLTITSFLQTSFSEKNARNVLQTCRGLTQFSFVCVAKGSGNI